MVCVPGLISMHNSVEKEARTPAWYFPVNTVAYAISMSSHLVAILLGGAISSFMQTDAWPSAARQLTGIQVVVAIPGALVDSNDVSIGDPVFLHQYPAVNGRADSPCLLSVNPFRLLSSGETFLLSQELAKASDIAIGRIRNATAAAGSNESGRTFKIGKRTGTACSPRTSDPDVIVDRTL